MRPLKLVMTGFESYREKTEINFEDLGKNGLYLIAGDTGANILREAADVNDDGAINVADVTSVLSIMAGNK